MGIVGGLILSGLSSLIDYGFGSLSADKQKENQLEMMEKQHQYNLDTMRVQNEYQVEQWNRENEYNTPLNVANRFRAAGIAPQAVFGSGAQGAGIAGGLSSAPSGGSPSGSASAPSRMTDTIGGLTSLLGLDLESERVRAQTKASDARAKLDDQKAEMEQLKVMRERFYQENGDLFIEMNRRGWEADVKQVEAFKASVDKAWYRFEKQQAFDINQAELDNLGMALKHYEANIAKLVADKKLSEEQANNLRAENAVILERYNTQVAVTKKENALVDVAKSQEGVYSAQADKLIAEVAQEWAKIGIEGAEVVLRVVEMLMPFIPRNAKSKQKLTQSVERTVMRNSKGKVTGTIEKTKDVIAD